MTFYALVFNRSLSRPYKAFHDEFVGNPRIQRWFHYIKSAYVIGTDMTPRELSLHFRKVADEHNLPKRHFVFQIDLRYHSGWLPNEAWKWVRDNQGQ